MPVMTTAEAEGLRVFRRGKVRDTFELDDNTLLMVATDRLSAFDVVLPTPIPDKGRVLTQMSRWWFAKTNQIVPNHLLPDDPEAVPAAERDDWLERSMRVRRAERIDIECVVRGYISGSGWKEYKKEGTLAGEPLPAGAEGVGQARPPALHAGREERHRPRREHQPRQPRRRRRQGAGRAPRARLARAVHLRRGALHGARRHPRRHQVRVRLRRRRAHAHRRDLHARIRRASGTSRSTARASR